MTTNHARKETSRLIDLLRRDLDELEIRLTKGIASADDEPTRVRLMRANQYLDQADDMIIESMIALDDEASTEPKRR